MTWRLKVQGVVIAVSMLGVLALAGGASWVEGFVDSLFSLF